jgi:protoporphyrinogen/coproporphyrinogen III oxidase
MPTLQVVVVGAGIAGLTAAYQLKQAGMDVLVLEARRNYGGRMLTVDWEGFKVDPGAKFVTTSDKFLLEMVEALGLREQIVRQTDGLPIIIYRNGEFHAANFLSIPSYLRWSGVSLGGRLAMLKLAPYFLRIGKLENVYHLEGARGGDEEDMEEFFYRRINPEMFEYWAAPMFETMCSYTGQDCSRKAFLALMASYLNADSVTFKDGIGALPQALAARVGVQLGARVKRISAYPDGSGVKIELSQEGEESKIEASAVVVAVPGNHVLDLFAEPMPAWQKFFPQVSYSISAMQYHLLETDYQPPVPGCFIPRKERYADGRPIPINSISFELYKGGRWLLLTDPRVTEFNLELPDETLIQRAVEATTTLFPGTEGSFIAHRIFRWAEKVPTFRPGYLAALHQFWSDPQEGPVYFCGDYFAGPSTGGALYSGKECAERLGNRV